MRYYAKSSLRCLCLFSIVIRPLIVCKSNKKTDRNSHPTVPISKLFAALFFLWFNYRHKLLALYFFHRQSFFRIGGVSLRCDELIPFAMNVDNLDIGIITKQFPKLCDIDVHASCVEVIVVYPDRFEGKVPLKDFIDVGA